MFLFHIAYALGLIALAVGIIMIAWSLRNEGKGVGLVKIFGYIISIIAIIAMLCTTYYGILYWSKGNFSNSMGMSMIQNKSMMPGGGIGNMPGAMMNNNKTNTQ